MSDRLIRDLRVPKMNASSTMAEAADEIERLRALITYRCNDCRTIVPIDDTNSSKDATEPTNRNDCAARGRFIANPHFHGDH